MTYTSFAVSSFLAAAQYWFASIYFVVLTVIWFKIWEYGKRKEKA